MDTPRKRENWTTGYAALAAAVRLLPHASVILAAVQHATERKRWWMAGLKAYHSKEGVSLKTATRRWDDALAELRTHDVLRDYLPGIGSWAAAVPVDYGASPEEQELERQDSLRLENLDRTYDPSEDDQSSLIHRNANMAAVWGDWMFRNWKQRGGLHEHELAPRAVPPPGVYRWMRPTAPGFAPGWLWGNCRRFSRAVAPYSAALGERVNAAKKAYRELGKREPLPVTWLGEPIYATRPAADARYTARRESFLIAARDYLRWPKWIRDWDDTAPALHPGGSAFLSWRYRLPAMHPAVQSELQAEKPDPTYWALGDRGRRARAQLWLGYPATGYRRPAGEPWRLVALGLYLDGKLRKIALRGRDWHYGVSAVVMRGLLRLMRQRVSERAAAAKIMSKRITAARRATPSVFAFVRQLSWWERGGGLVVRKVPLCDVPVKVAPDWKALRQENLRRAHWRNGGGI